LRMNRIGRASSDACALLPFMLQTTPSDEPPLAIRLSSPGMRFLRLLLSLKHSSPDRTSSFTF
jgi:hypothetical protein